MFEFMPHLCFLQFVPSGFSKIAVQANTLSRSKLFLLKCWNISISAICSELKEASLTQVHPSTGQLMGVPSWKSCRLIINTIIIIICFGFTRITVCASKNSHNKTGIVIFQY